MADTEHDTNIVIKIIKEPVSVEDTVLSIKTEDSGCVATYVGLIRNNSHGRSVLSVEYRDVDGKAYDALLQIAREMMQKWPVNGVAIVHRVGILKVGEINFLVAVAAGHRQEGFAACRYAVDQFKNKLPTLKLETYADRES